VKLLNNVELASIPPKTCGKWLARLKRGNKIEFRGAPKTGGYYNNEKKS